MATKRKAASTRRKGASIRKKAADLGGNDEIVFAIEWNPTAVSAGLDHLIYNDGLVTEEPDYGVPGKVTVTFHRSRSVAHRFQWSLLFPGRTLSDLVASASINGTSKELKAADDDQKNRWADRGDWKD